VESQAAIAATVSVIGIGVIAQSASGSPLSGITTNLVTANLHHKVLWNNDGVKVQTKAATDVRVQKLVLAPSSYTGRHHHPGIVIWPWNRDL
jgi:hypothetical protein